MLTPESWFLPFEQIISSFEYCSIHPALGAALIIIPQTLQD